jgi:hypothetical protein
LADEEIHPRLSEEIRTDEVEEVPVGKLREGDAFVDDGKIVWVALSDAEDLGQPGDDEYPDVEISVEVQHRDGATGDRVWNDEGMKLPVLRAG